jgi:hypothetical protein
VTAGASRRRRYWTLGLAALWASAVVIVSIQGAAHHTNNLAIFRTSWDNLIAGRDLYGLNPWHQDYYKYSPTFALLFAPLAIVPFGVSMLLWNALNAGMLYWSFGRVLSAEQAFVARAIVFLDVVGSMQNAQSNALVAGLMILAFADFERRREGLAALSIALATLIKIFPIVAAAFAIFRPFRLHRFAAWSIVVAAVLLAVPLTVLTPAQLADQYRSWQHLRAVDAVTRGYSMMEQAHIWLGVEWPNGPIQLVGAAILLAPLVRYSNWGVAPFRLLFLASVLMFCVLFNHKAESPTFVIALAGVGIWFAISHRSRADWILLGIVIVGTVLSASDAMPEILQQRFFQPYRLKILPVFAVWIATQLQLWRIRPSPTSSLEPAAAPAA